MKHYIVSATFLLIFTSSLFCQIEALTTDGRKVILQNDGTWTFADTTSVTDRRLDPNDCSSMIISETDKMTGKTFVSSRTIVVTDDGKTGFKIFIMRLKEETISLSIGVYGASSCIDEGSKINILFTDGNRIELKTDNKFNCDGDATVYFGGYWGKKKELNMLRYRQIATMRVWTTKSFVQKDFNEENKILFQGGMKCLLNK